MLAPSMHSMNKYSFSLVALMDGIICALENERRRQGKQGSSTNVFMV